MLFIKAVITVYFDNNTKHISMQCVGKKEDFFNFKPRGACAAYMPLYFERMNVFGSHISLNNSAPTAGIGAHKYVAWR